MLAHGVFCSVTTLLWSQILVAEVRPYNWWISEGAPERCCGDGQALSWEGCCLVLWSSDHVETWFCQKLRQYFYNLLSKEKSGTVLDCGRINFPIFVINIWRHLELSHSRTNEGHLWRFRSWIANASCTGCSTSKPEAVEWCKCPGLGCVTMQWLVGSYTWHRALSLQIVCESEEGFWSKADVSPCTCESIVTPWHQAPLSGGRNTETFLFLLKLPHEGFGLVCGQLRKSLVILQDSWNSLE